MATIHEIISCDNEPHLLTRDQRSDLPAIINEFLSYRNLSEHREILWTILSAAVTGNINDLYTATDVGEWVVYFRELEEFIEAVWVKERKG